MNTRTDPERRAMTDTLSYPIGRWAPPDQFTGREIDAAVARIAALPGRLRSTVQGLDPVQLATPYRPGGWTVHQLVHHVADSHINAYVRVKLGLTEEEPRITAYDQDAWASLLDVDMVPVTVSLDLVDALHARWSALLGSLTPAQWSRHYLHPENGRQRLDAVAHHYAWHGDHHVAQITALIQRSGW
jgi:hypothetical protein